MDDAIASIVDGTPVDWDGVARRAEAVGDSAWTTDLRIIYDVANFYRLSAVDTRRSSPLRSQEPAIDDEPTVNLVVGEEQTARYQAALRHLERRERHAVIGRLELMTSYYDLAAVLGYHYRGTRAAVAAARRAVARALKHLTIEMGDV